MIDLWKEIFYSPLKILKGLISNSKWIFLSYFAFENTGRRKSKHMSLVKIDPNEINWEICAGNKRKLYLILFKFFLILICLFVEIDGDLFNYFLHFKFEFKFKLYYFFFHSFYILSISFIPNLTSQFTAWNMAFSLNRHIYIYNNNYLANVIISKWAYKLILGQITSYFLVNDCACEENVFA